MATPFTITILSRTARMTRYTRSNQPAAKSGHCAFSMIPNHLFDKWLETSPHISLAD